MYDDDCFGVYRLFAFLYTSHLHSYLLLHINTHIYLDIMKTPAPTFLENISFGSHSGKQFCVRFVSVVKTLFFYINKPPVFLCVSFDSLFYPPPQPRKLKIIKC